MLIINNTKLGTPSEYWAQKWQHTSANNGRKIAATRRDLREQINGYCLYAVLYRQLRKGWSSHARSLDTFYLHLLAIERMSSNKYSPFKLLLVKSLQYGYS